MTRCPSALELEAYLLGPARSPLAPHLEACARCQGEVAAMRAAGEAFRREVFPATVDAVLEASRPRGLPRWVLGAAPLAAAAAAAVLLVLFRPPAGHVGTKGGGLGLSVFVSDGAAARAVTDGEPVPAGAAIRFQVRPARACRLWVVSVDGAGQVSRLFPPAGDSAAALETASTLPGGARLDGRAGPERIFAICSPAPLPYADVERAARASAAGGEGPLRAAGALSGLPPGAAQATVLLEKRP